MTQPSAGTNPPQFDAPPPVVVDAVAALAAVPAASLRELADALAAGGAHSRAELGALLRQVHPSMSRSSTSAAVAFLMAMGSRPWAGDGTRRAAFLRFLLRSASVDPESEEGRELEHALEGILTAAPLRISAKASSLQLEHEKVLYNARILSDIRPIFSDTDAEPGAIEGVIINHMLRIEYGPVGADTATMFFALDDDDLARFRGVIERAMDKSQTMRDWIEREGLRVYEPWRTDDEDERAE